MKNSINRMIHAIIYPKCMYVCMYVCMYGLTWSVLDMAAAVADEYDDDDAESI